jgi:hypothetical protein
MGWYEASYTVQGFLIGFIACGLMFMAASVLDGEKRK